MPFYQIIWIESRDAGRRENLGVPVVICGHNLSSPGWNKVIWSTKIRAPLAPPVPASQMTALICEKCVIYSKSALPYSESLNIRNSIHTVVIKYIRMTQNQQLIILCYTIWIQVLVIFFNCKGFDPIMVRSAIHAPTSSASLIKKFCVFSSSLSNLS